jgi:aminoglycoside phosphotransferase (APT) family kinase protein
MLSPDDQRLVAIEPSLPGLSTLLDDEAMTLVLRKAWPSLRATRAHANYIRYKPNTSCIVGYEIETENGARRFGYARAHRAESAEKLRIETDEAIVLPGAAAIVFRPGYDAELPGLRRLEAHDDDGFFQKLTRHARQGQAIVPLAYKPERRWVARAGDAPWPLGVIKCYDQAGFEQARLNAKRFRSRGSLRVPRRLARSSRFAAMMVEWVDGRPLRASDRINDDDLARIARALSKLHVQRAPDLTLIGTEALTARVTAIHDLIATIAPEHAVRAADLANRLIAGLDEPQQPVSLHGDFYADQVLLLPDGRIGLIDLDEAAAGDAALDLGNFVAHGIAAGAHATREQIDAVIAALRRGYAASPAALPVPNESAIRRFAAVACYQLATRAFRRHERGWNKSIERLLNASEDLLEGSSRASGKSLAIDDPFDAGADPKLGPFLASALDPAQAQDLIRPLLAGHATLRRIRVRRLKPQRRCLIEYEFDDITLIGKVRGKGADEKSFAALRAIHENGFADDSADSIFVPKPIGIISSMAMTLQTKVPGTPATQLIVGPEGIALLRRIAQALVKLHRCGVTPRKQHTIDDELRILGERLNDAAAARPDLATRIEALRHGSEDLASSIPPPRQLVGIHRDFYADQVLVDGERLYLLDFDLFCLGDPALDAGNFIAHLTEQALRTLGDATALACHERAFEETFCQLHGQDLRRAVRAYATLTLARHVWISHNIAERRPWTEALLALCEQRLASPALSSATTSANQRQA